jgi:PST family polysaccharide transporter
VARGQLRDGAVVTFSNILGNGNQRVVDLIVGYYLGSAALGYLRIASRGVELLLELGLRPITSVAFSSFSALQGDRPALERAYQRIIQLTSIVSLPLFIGVIPVAGVVVTALFGNKWNDSVILLQILSLGGFFVPIVYFKTNLLFAVGRMKETLESNCAEFILTVVTAVIFSRISLEAAAVGTVVRAFLVAPLVMYYVWKYADISAGRTLAMVLPAALAASVMAAVVWGAGAVLPSDWNGLERVAAQVALGGVLYPVLLLLFFRTYMRGAIDALRPVLPAALQPSDK